MNIINQNNSILDNSLTITPEEQKLRNEEYLEKLQSRISSDINEANGYKQRWQVNHNAELQTQFYNGQYVDFIDVDDNISYTYDNSYKTNMNDLLSLLSDFNTRPNLISKNEPAIQTYEPMSALLDSVHVDLELSKHFNKAYKKALIEGDAYLGIFRYASDGTKNPVFEGVNEEMKVTLTSVRNMILDTAVTDPQEGRFMAACYSNYSINDAMRWLHAMYPNDVEMLKLKLSQIRDNVGGILQSSNFGAFPLDSSSPIETIIYEEKNVDPQTGKDVYAQYILMNGVIVFAVPKKNPNRYSWTPLRFDPLDDSPYSKSISYDAVRIQLDINILESLIQTQAVRTTLNSAIFDSAAVSQLQDADLSGLVSGGKMARVNIKSGQKMEDVVTFLEQPQLPQFIIDNIANKKLALEKLFSIQKVSDVATKSANTSGATDRKVELALNPLKNIMENSFSPFLVDFYDNLIQNIAAMAELAVQNTETPDSVNIVVQDISSPSGHRLKGLNIAKLLESRFAYRIDFSTTTLDAQMSDFNHIKELYQLQQQYQKEPQIDPMTGQPMPQDNGIEITMDTVLQYLPVRNKAPLNALIKKQLIGK